MQRRLPGSEWRVLAHDGERDIEHANEGVFDELVVDKWLHVEQMDEAAWFVRIGDARVLVRIGEHGEATVDVERGFYAEPLGTTTTGSSPQT